MSKRKEPSSPNEAIRESARIAFEDEESALRSEIRTMKRKHARFAEEKATFETKLRAEKRMFMRKWSLEAEPVEKALAEAQGRLDRLREKEEERRHHLSPDENASRLDKLPPELWDKVLDNLDENDLFPLALSCRYFRQKQKDLVARKSELRMRTVFKMNQGSRSNRSLSSDYIRFAYASALNTPLADLQGASAERDMALQDAQIFFMWIAKSRGDYDLIKALGWSEMNPELNTLLVDVWSQGAALRNNLDLLKFLHENRLTRRSWGASCTAKAASRGRLEILEYAKEKGIPLWEPEELDRWDPCAYAAFGGKLKVLQWLRSNGCPWNSRTCENAARLGRFKTLCWALENGCPWDVEECYRTADHEIKEWIDSTGRTLYAGQAVLGALQNLQ